MQILGSSLASSSQHQYSREERLTRIARERVIDNGPPLERPENAKLTANTHSPVPPVLEKRDDENNMLDENLDARLMLLKALVEALTGKEIEQHIHSPDTQTSEPTAIEQAPTTDAPAEPNNAQFETTIFTHYELSEYEYTAVNFNGSVLVDGGNGEQLLNIDFSMTMARSYRESVTELSVRAGRLTDPLVLNFNGETVALSDQTTLFDLNSTGIAQAIPTLSSNSAYLALDKNGDGMINNGTELFGPTSSNGFAELASFDEDGNGFIDASDSVYARLTLFRPQDQQQQSLTDAGISALYTEAVSSPWQLTDTNNNRLGQIRSTSFYLDNQGQAGSLQQIDLVV